MKSLHNYVVWSILFASLSLVANQVQAQAQGMVVAPQTQQRGIAASKHNLSTTGLHTNHMIGEMTEPTGAGQGEICIFCHTPHGANTGIQAPIWNKGSPTPGVGIYQAYTTTNSSTIDSTTLGPGSISRACLTCHDGTQAMDNMINAPGSGGFAPGGARLAGVVWTGALANGLMPGGDLNPNIVTMLGTDLRNDHPVGMNFCGGSLTPNVPGNCADNDFPLAHTNGAGRFWIEGGTAVAGVQTPPSLSGPGFQKTDFPLYATNQVECATCHDPHSTQRTFLRRVGANNNSGMCLTCHAK
jgi:predicted CXXCH cytochrome family protein